MASKKIISDMVLPQKKEITAQLFREPPPAIKHPAPQKIRKINLRIVLFMAGLIIIAGAASAFMSKINISIAPKRSVLEVNQTVAVSQSPANDTEIKFKKFSIPIAKTKKFPATGKADDAAKAEGIIVVFNKGKDAQVLIASTRFETPDGKIYKIPANIVVPGAKTEDGKSTPGSKETKAMAEKAGPEYNIGLSDFTLPALKGSPRFSLIFGRSKTEMTGGSAGDRVVVGKEDKTNALASLLAEAKSEASSITPGKIPQNEFLISPAVEYFLIKETASPEAGEAAKEFSATVEGEARGVSVDREELEKMLIKKYPQLTGNAGNLKITNLDKLSVKIFGYKFDAQSFKMQISGKAEIEGRVNLDSIRAGIAEKQLFNPSDILSSYPALSRAEVHFKPFWATVFKGFLASRPSSIDIQLEER